MQRGSDADCGCWTLAALITVLAIAFWPLLTHPTDVVSDGFTDLILGHLPYRVLMTNSLRSLEGQGFSPSARPSHSARGS